MSNFWTATQTVNQLLDDPTTSVSEGTFDWVNVWAEKHLEYVRSINAETPARIQMQIKRNFDMQVKVLGLKALLGNGDDFNAAQLLYTQKPSNAIVQWHVCRNRIACYSLISATTDLALQHLLKLTTTPTKIK